MTLGAGFGFSFGGLGGLGLSLSAGASVDIGGILGYGGVHRPRSYNPNSEDDDGGNGEEVTDLCPWVSIDPKDPKPQKAAQVAVDQFNKENKNNLKYKYVLEAWIHTLDSDTDRYLLALVAQDCLHRSLQFVAVVLEKREGDCTNFTLEYFEQIEHLAIQPLKPIN